MPLSEYIKCAANILVPVATGDNANIILYAVLGIVAVALVVFLAFKDKIIKPKDQKDADEHEK